MQDKNEIISMLTKILVEEFEIDAEDISPEVNLYEDLDLDSIDAVDLVVKLREITGKKITPESFKQVRTFSDVVEEIHQLTQAA